MYWTGLILGILFGYVLQRSRVCFTGLVRDVYLMKERYNVILFFAIVCIEGFIYYAFAAAGMVRMASYLPPFSLLSVAAGSFAFGMGAVMSGGCLTATLVKCGDGRVSGWLYLAVFVASAYFFAAGSGIGLSKEARHIAVVEDALAVRTTRIPLVLFAAASAALFAVMIRHQKKDSFVSPVKPKFSGLRRRLFGTEWSREAGSAAIGAVLGIAFFISSLTGRYFGVAITTPVMSWVYMFTGPDETCGGCNPYDEHFGWGSLLVLGIILGSFISAKLSGEFRIIRLERKELIRGAAGAALMGFGAMWGLGCLLGNGLVGTAQLSLKSWYALVFLVLGIWTAARVFFAPLLKD